MLADDHNVSGEGQPTTQNAEFVINAIDTLSGLGALYDLRARSLFTVDADADAFDPKARKAMVNKIRVLTARTWGISMNERVTTGSTPNTIGRSANPVMPMPMYLIRERSPVR